MRGDVPRIRRSAAPATSQATRNARTAEGSVGRARHGTRRRVRLQGVSRLRSAPERASRRRPRPDATRRRDTPSCRMCVRSATLRAARAGRPGRVRGPRAS
jgi:hypothetical protein